MADHHSRAVYVISVAAELAGVHPQTLRIYERKGLVDPARTAGGSRRYSEADIERLRRIAELTDEGLNLAGVQAGARAGGRDRRGCGPSSTQLAAATLDARGRARSAASGATSCRSTQAIVAVPGLARARSDLRRSDTDRSET